MTFRVDEFLQIVVEEDAIRVSPRLLQGTSEYGDHIPIALEIIIIIIIIIIGINNHLLRQLRRRSNLYHSLNYKISIDCCSSLFKHFQQSFQTFPGSLQLIGAVNQISNSTITIKNSVYAWLFLFLEVMSWSQRFELIELWQEGYRERVVVFFFLFCFVLFFRTLE